MAVTSYFLFKIDIQTYILIHIWNKVELKVESWLMNAVKFHLLVPPALRQTLEDSRAQSLSFYKKCFR